jgi:nucleotide-binding universal stress UspA family protein
VDPIGSCITLLFVLEPPRMVPLGFLDAAAITPSHADAKEIDQVQFLLDQVAADLPQAKVEKLVEVGRPADTILATAERLGVNLIVMGARGLNLGGRWLLGSVSDRVLQHAGRPVTVVH